MEMIEKIKSAGVVGAGGAGFPSHVKLNTKADIVIVNGAECEPLLRVDQTLMELESDKLVYGLSKAMEIVEAKRGVICLKGKYKNAIANLEKAIERYNSIDIQVIDDYYPAGDEQQLIFEVTQKVIPISGLPKDVGAVVHNVNTLLNIADALNSKNVTHKHVTVTGEVETPITVEVPIGCDISLIIDMAKLKIPKQDATLIIGGPMMGRVSYNFNERVTKTMGGIIVLPKTHTLITRKDKDIERELKLAKAICCQCNNCSLICPRNDLGLGTSPHKVMRAFAHESAEALGNVNHIFSCCDCGLCTHYGCEFGLSPGRIMTMFKRNLLQEGVKPVKEIPNEPNNIREYKKVPTRRLIGRLGLKQYDNKAPLVDFVKVNEVNIDLRQHIGAKSVPCVKEGQRVSCGDIIAEIPQNSLGANIHASIDGTVKSVNDDFITIQA